VETATIGHFDLFGTGGRDATAVRAAVRGLEGATVPMTEEGFGGFVRQVAERVTASSGAPPTDVAPVCCDANGRWTVYAGLAWGSADPPVRSRPGGSAVLPPSLVRAYDSLMDAIEPAVRAQASEDHAEGYALSSDPTLRARQLAFRQEALTAGTLVHEVVAGSKDDTERAIAAHALGYQAASERQIAALVDAARDPDEQTRNNAVRALGVIADSGQAIATTVPFGPFVALLHSGHWTDRNKGLMVMSFLSASRPAALLERLRRDVRDDLVEMARWRERGHADPARLLLGRAAGLDEARLQQLIQAGDVDAIVTAAMH
jgi:hypothetical protein